MPHACIASKMLQGGGLLRAPVLAHDASVVFVPCADAVLAFSTATAELLYKLQEHTGSAEVTALCLHPLDASRLYSASQDGQLTLWDLTTGSAAQTWSMESPVESLVVQGDTAYVSCHWREQGAGRVLAYNLGTAKAAGPRAKLAAARRLVASSCGQLLATVDRHTAMVWRASSFPHDPMVLTHTKSLVCAALSGTGDTLAVGDTTGRVVFWHGIHEALHAGLPATAVGMSSHAAPRTIADSPLPLQSTAHWHAGPVCCLAFTSDGAFLLSGGHEGVLVVWDMSSGRRTYLPRLGSRLCHIAACLNVPARVAVSLADNVVRLVDLAALHVECSVRGVFCDPAAPTGSCMVIQPGTGFLTMTSRAATLQFFDLFKNAHIDHHQLFCRGTARTSFTAAQGAAATSAPTHVVYSVSGEMLVTVEQSLDVAEGAPSIMKIWNRRQLQPCKCAYSLAAGRGNPCSIQDSVRAVALHPQRPVVAIALGSGGICLLELESRQALGGGRWVPSHTAHGTGACALAFSPDGTVLAVGSTPSCPVVLLDPATHQTLAVLPPVINGTQSLPIQCLAFLADRIHLGVQWSGGIALYNMLTGGLRWARQLSTTLLTVDARSARVAIGTHSGALALLDAHGPASEGAGLLCGHCVRAAHFLEPQQPLVQDPRAAASQLVVLNNVQQFAAVLPVVPQSPVGSGPQQRSAVQFHSAALIVGPRSTARQARPDRTGGGAVTAGVRATASHLLAAAAELCPLSLEPLLLA